MLKGICLVLGLICAPVANAVVSKTYNPRPVKTHFKRVMSSLDRLNLAIDTDRSLDGMIKIAAWQLRLRGYDSVADELEADWGNQFSGLLPAAVVLEDLGSWAPISEWIAVRYELLELLLGEDVMENLRLTDIKIINFAVPVVFKLSIIDPGAIDAPEYKLHFVPLSGTVAWWTTFLACEVAVWGTDFTFLCGFAGDGMRFVAKAIAPRYSDRWYESVYQ